MLNRKLHGLKLLDMAQVKPSPFPQYFAQISGEDETQKILNQLNDQFYRRCYRHLNMGTELLFSAPDTPGSNMEICSETFNTTLRRCKSGGKCLLCKLLHLAGDVCEISF